MIPRRLVLLSALLLLAVRPASAQLDPLAPPPPNPLTNPTLSPGTALLFDLEARFQKDTLAGGGKAFATWFADDAVTLGNGQAPVRGRDAIARRANWSPSDYQLTWSPQGGQMSPSGDMGFTWGSYEGHGKDRNGNPIVDKGRYMTIWKKQPDGNWKVVLDSSNDAPPESGDCCKVK